MRRSQIRDRRRQGSGTFYRDGNGYRVRGRLNGAAVKFRVATRAEASVAVDQLNRGEDPRAERQARERTVALWLREYLPTRTDLKDRTRVGYEQLAEDYIIPAIGQVPLPKLTHAQVVAMIDGMRAQCLSNSVLKNTRNVLSGALKRARKRNYVQTNAASDLDIGKSGSNFLVPGFDLRMAARMLDALQDHQFYDLYALLLYTALRVGEAVGLDWRYVHLAKGELTIVQAETRKRAEPGSGHKTQRTLGSPKNNKSRVVPLNDEARRLLWRRYHRMGNPKSGLVFPSKRDPARPIATGWTLRELKGVLDEAGLPVLTHHQLRHAAISLLIAAGWDIPVVSKIAGHASAEITYRLYAHVIGEREKLAVEALTFFPRVGPPTKASRRSGRSRRTQDRHAA